MLKNSQILIFQKKKKKKNYDIDNKVFCIAIV